MTKRLVSCELWCEVKNVKETKRLIVACNQSHLVQQIYIEKGRVHDPLMEILVDNHGTNYLNDSLLKGELTLEDAVDKSIQAWISAS